MAGGAAPSRPSGLRGVLGPEGARPPPTGRECRGVETEERPGSAVPVPPSGLGPHRMELRSFLPPSGRPFSSVPCYPPPLWAHGPYFCSVFFSLFLSNAAHDLSPQPRLCPSSARTAARLGSGAVRGAGGAGLLGRQERQL